MSCLRGKKNENKDLFENGTKQTKRIVVEVNCELNENENKQFKQAQGVCRVKIGWLKMKIERPEN